MHVRVYPSLMVSLLSHDYSTMVCAALIMDFLVSLGTESAASLSVIAKLVPCNFTSNARTWPAFHIA
jgi:hypothetical protein